MSTRLVFMEKISDTHSYLEREIVISNTKLPACLVFQTFLEMKGREGYSYWKESAPRGCI